jgi:hypothetical protein
MSKILEYLASWVSGGYKYLHEVLCRADRYYERDRGEGFMNISALPRSIAYDRS